jgi:hypothetical protein
MNIDRIAYWTTEPKHLFGLFFLIVTGISIYAGKTRTRGGSVSRAQEPKTFWFIVAMYFLAGIVFCYQK